MARSNTPYDQQADYAFWKRSVADIPPQAIDPAITFPFRINKDAKVATAGSCFAQHIARHLHKSGFNYLVTENAHPLLNNEISGKYNYGAFTARYGNIYSSRQLLQLFQRAYGQFAPVEDFWQVDSNIFIDPFRPNIQPKGFSSLEELHADRRQHLKCVKEAFESLDVFIFTLGLTEIWQSRQDGAVFPLCPGVRGGTYDESLYEFVNLDVDEVVADLHEFIQQLSEVNSDFKIILTISPVPLMATAENRHVLVSTTLSKSVLRVAADQICNDHKNVAYFPSYEIITSPASRGDYYAENLRDIKEQGVEHVMATFFRNATIDQAASPQLRTAIEERARQDTLLKKLDEIVKVICDEELIDQE